MSEKLDTLSAHIQGLAKVESAAVVAGELTLYTKAENLLALLVFLRDDAACGFTQLMDIGGVDYPEREQRFEVVYHLLALKHNQRVRVKVTTDEQTGIPSVVGIFSSAGWFEREVWDLYGVRFDGNPDLRRILTDYGFDGHPLRKDFPLTGYVELRYNPELGRVAYEPVQLAQAYRSFDFTSPWEGAKYALAVAVDEKAKVGT